MRLWKREKKWLDEVDLAISSALYDYDILHWVETWDSGDGGGDCKCGQQFTSRTFYNTYAFAFVIITHVYVAAFDRRRCATMPIYRVFLLRNQIRVYLHRVEHTFIHCASTDELSTLVFVRRSSF